MESVLLGIAAPVAVGTAGSLIGRTLHAAAKPFAAVLHAITSAESYDANESAAAALGSLQDRLEAIRTQLVLGIENSLSSAGIDLSEPITLRVSGADGRLEVVGEHAQKALIESALANDPELASKFTEVVALHQLLAAADKHADPERARTVEWEHTDYDAVTAIFAQNDEGSTLEFERSERDYATF